MTNKRFTVKQRQGATIYSIQDYYGELPLSEGMYYKSNAEKLCKWLNTQHELLNTLYNENEQLKREIEDFQTLLASKEEVYLKPIITMIDEKMEQCVLFGDNKCAVVLSELKQEIGDVE